MANTIMKSIACLIIAIPTFFVVTQQSTVVGQQFPSTSHGSFDGLVVEVPEATASLPSLSGQGPELSLGNSPTPATQVDATKVGSYQTVLAPDEIVQVPGSTSQRAVPTPANGQQQQFESGPIIIQPAQQQVVLPTALVAPAAQPVATQIVYVERAPAQQVQVQQVQSAPVYASTDGIVFVEEGSCEEPGNPNCQCQACSGGAAIQPPAGFVIAENQLSAQPQQVIVRRQPPTHHQVKQERRATRQVIRQETRQVNRQTPGPRQAPQAIRTPGARSGNRVYNTAGISAILLNRNFGDNVDFSVANGDFLSSRDADFDSLGGIDAFFGRRRANGRGWEARYFGLFTTDTSTQVDGDPENLLFGLTQLSASPTGTPTASDLFDLADPHVLTVETELNNIEFNLLRNVNAVNRASQTELLIGFRYLQFGEGLLFQGIGVQDPSLGPVTTEGTSFFSTAENELLGLQVGARSDYRLTGRMTLHAGIKAGAFNNDIETTQRVDFELSNGATINPSILTGPVAGENFDVGNEVEVTSLLAEVDLAVSWQVSNAARVRVGYRIIGVSDVAFASEQIGTDFTDPNILLTPITDGNLVLQGGYVGLEFAF